MSARDIRVYRSLSSKLVKIEERGRLLGILIALGVRFKEEEEFLRHNTKKLKIQKKKEIIKMMFFSA